jgi:riboflavin synthase
LPIKRAASGFQEEDRMFTGIVEERRPVTGIHRADQALELRVDLGDLAEGVRIGDSLAIAGCCLTVAGLQGTEAAFHLMGETLGVTTLEGLAAGRLVNVERALRLGDRVGGHLVSGHVDGTGLVLEFAREPGQTTLAIEAPPGLADLLVAKGSIAVDGVSLTVIGVRGSVFSVGLIPHTLAVTTLGLLGAGDRVNLEADLFGKWVRRLLGPYLPDGRRPQEA